MSGRLLLPFDARAVMLSLLAASGACAHPAIYLPQDVEAGTMAPGDVSDRLRVEPPLAPDATLSNQTAYRQLLRRGPERFAKVSESIYRGGQPDDDQLRLLRDLGVTTIINLRREEPDVWRNERDVANTLGIRFVHYPFFGVFGADDDFIFGILDELTEDKSGVVYVHCKHGRDRTSLVIALYRVFFENWNVDRAWREEALAYGHAPTAFYRELGQTFRALSARSAVASPVVPRPDPREGSGQPSAKVMVGAGRELARR